MPHQCVRCEKLYDDGAEELLKGCSCGGKFFFFMKSLPKEEKIKLSEEEKKQIVGGKVLEGTAKKGLRFSLVRKDIVIGDGKTENIQQRTIAVSEVGAGEEFGALISASTLVAPGDILHFFEEETTKRILS